jgi:type I restriction enzyme S subunit
VSVENLPLRYAATVLVSNVDKKSADGEIPVRLVNYTDVYYRPIIRPDQEFMMATATMDQVARFGVRPGDSIITKDSETPDDIAVSTYVEQSAPDMVCGYHLALLRPSDRVVPKFLSWALASDQVRGQFSIRANGMTRYGLTYEAIQSVVVPLPPLDEQRRIADFLDDQVARIDKAIALRRDQVVVIDSSVGTVARRNVTGVDANQEVVASGIPWAPFIPTGWGAPRICQVARMGTGHTPSRAEPGYWVDCDIPWLTTADVHRFRHDEIDELTDTEGRLSQQGLDNSAAVLHPKGTVALSRTASAGFSVVMGADMATSQDFATWTCGPQLDNMFLLWCLRAMRGDLIGRLAMGSTHKTIYFPDLMAIRIPLPDLPSQRRIASETTSFAMSCRAATAAVRRSMDLLRDYKTSLITQAVAGDLDVTTARQGVPA